MTAHAAIDRPTAVGFLLAHPAHFIALGFGTGLSPIAPGTVGTLLAFPLYAVLAHWPHAVVASRLAIVALFVRRRLGLRPHRPRSRRAPTTAA